MNQTVVLGHNVIAAMAHSTEETLKFYVTALSEQAKEIEELKAKLAEATKVPEETPAP